MIATGESLKPDPVAVALRVRHLPCVAVNDAYKIAPWAKAIVGCDGEWWKENPEALELAGEKWAANGNVKGVARMRRPGIYTHTNSGLLGLFFAADHGAQRVLLLGVDMKGSHYFGPHLTRPNTIPSRFALFIDQFKAAQRRIKCEVINCNPDSALDCFPRMTLDAALEANA